MIPRKNGEALAFSIGELAYLLVFAMVFIIMVLLLGFADLKNELENSRKQIKVLEDSLKKISDIPKASKYYAAEIKIIGANRFLIDEKEYNIVGIGKKFAKEIKAKIRKLTGGEDDGGGSWIEHTDDRN